MRRLFRLLTLLALMLTALAPAAAQAADSKTVSLATLADYPPLCQLKDGALPGEETIPPGQDSTLLEGFTWDVVREAFHSRGWTIDLTVATWDTSLATLAEGGVDAVFPATRTAERAAAYEFSDNPVDVIDLVLYVPTGDIARWSDPLADVAGRRVAVIEGWDLGSEWDEAAEKAEIDRKSTRLNSSHYS